jgi:hypothetical protein
MTHNNINKFRKCFLICINNEDYPASLELRKIYQVIADTKVAENQLLRVIDESDENYLYPADYFVTIELPKAAEKAFSLST